MKEFSHWKKEEKKGENLNSMLCVITGESAEYLEGEIVKDKRIINEIQWSTYWREDADEDR